MVDNSAFEYNVALFESPPGLTAAAPKWKMGTPASGLVMNERVIETGWQSPGPPPAHATRCGCHKRRWPEPRTRTVSRGAAKLLRSCMIQDSMAGEARRRWVHDLRGAPLRRRSWEQLGRISKRRDTEAQKRIRSIGGTNTAPSCDLLSRLCVSAPLCLIHSTPSKCWSAVCGRAR